MKVSCKWPPDLILWLGALQPELVAICHVARTDGRGGRTWEQKRYQILSPKSLLQVLWHPRKTFPLPALLQPHEWRFRQWAYLDSRVRHSLRMTPIA